MKLSGKVSIITGAGGGIGRAIAHRFSTEGSAVVIAGPTKEKVQRVAGEITAEGGNAIYTVTDVSNEAEVAEMVQSTLRQYGRLDILINNAGIAGPTALVHKLEREDWDRTMDINLTGAFLCAKHALPHLYEQKSGRIINITSIAGVRAYAYRSPYCASKWAMIGLTRTLAEEAGRYDITVNAIAPGPVHGPRMEAVIRARADEMNVSYEEMEKQYVEPTALKRMADESDIAAMALFLCSEEGRNITGETITISSGYRLA
ncbi:MAG TPA: SDR family oxidoreductase [Blastocatellia bacterium]|nr:SDR family oxidoreductase [Blastocatellia bacterium]